MANKQELAGKVALVTGIGKAAVLGHHLDNLPQAVSEIKEMSGEVIPLVADISQAEEMERALDSLIRQYGRLDIVFANAGINGVWAPMEELLPEEWNRTINTNLRGTFLTVKYAYLD